MRLWPARRKDVAPLEERLSLQEWADYFKFGGLAYTLGYQQTLQGDKETIGAGFGGYVAGAFQQSSVVFACILVRQLLFSEARFQFQQLRNGRPGDLFGTGALEPLENPWPGGTTGDLLSRMLQDADLAGNAFVARRPGGRLVRLRPDWTTIALGSALGTKEGAAGDPDAVVIGYVYQPGGPSSGEEPVLFEPDEVAHFKYVPDPSFQHRGMSWITPVLNEVMADKAATSHKLTFFENGATPNLIVSLPETVKEAAFAKWAQLIRETHEGVDNAYKTLMLGSGAQAQVVGADMRQLDFKRTQGAGETRIAAAAGVPPIIVGLSEGLEASTYSNYGQARRRFADGTMRPLWRQAAAALSAIIPVPSGARLWYDARDIAFLQEDVKDAADIMSTKAQGMRQLIDAGYVPDTVTAAFEADDFSLLKHSDLFSVQLQPPGTATPAANGSAPKTPQEAASALIAAASRRRHLEE